VIFPPLEKSLVFLSFVCFAIRCSTSKTPTAMVLYKSTPIQYVDILLTTIAKRLFVSTNASSGESANAI
jgi:hypothetical protein